MFVSVLILINLTGKPYKIFRKIYRKYPECILFKGLRSPNGFSLFSKEGFLNFTLINDCLLLLCSRIDAHSMLSGLVSTFKGKAVKK